MPNLNPQQKAPATPLHHKIHPLFRAFCPSADAPHEERTCICPILLLLLPLALMIVAFATGIFFDFDRLRDDLHRAYQAATTSVTVPILIGLGVAFLLISIWLFMRRTSRHRTATAH